MIGFFAIAIEKVSGLDVMHFQVTYLFGLFAAMLTSTVVALDCQLALPSPVPAVVWMSTCSATKRRIVFASDVLCSAIYRTIKVLIYLRFRRVDSKLFAAIRAGYYHWLMSDAPFIFRGAGQATKNVVALFAAFHHIKLFTAVLASQCMNSILRAFSGGVLNRAIHVIRAKLINTPSFNLDRFAAIGAGSVKFVIATLDVNFSSVTFDVLVGRMFNDATATAFA